MNICAMRCSKSQSPFGCGVVLDTLTDPIMRARDPEVSIAFRLWSGFGLPQGPRPPHQGDGVVSIAFRLWSGFGLAALRRQLATAKVSIAFRLWSGFGHPRRAPRSANGIGCLNRLSAVEWFWTPGTRCRLRRTRPSLNRLSAVEWFWTARSLVDARCWSRVVSIAFRLWSGFGRGESRRHPFRRRP